MICVHYETPSSKFLSKPKYVAELQKNPYFDTS
jgi:hypothetical protein